MRREVVFAVPGDLATPTGGYAYDRRIMAELSRLGWQVEIAALGDGFPYPDESTRSAAQSRLCEVAHQKAIVVDGLAFGVLPEAAAVLHKSHRVIALVHHPLAFETGLAQTQRRALHASEKQALAHPRHVVVTSAATKQLLESEYEVHGDRISVVPPGTDRADPARGSGEGVVTLLAVGSVVPRKGYDILIAAMAMLKDMPCRLVVAGDRTRDPATASQLDADIQRHGLGEKVSVIGAVAPEALTALYSRADIFVLASRFEGYGMAFAEAIAHGLPVVATRGGALAETVPDGVGLLVPTDDAAALAAALRRLIEDRDERQKFAAASRKAALRLPTWVESGKLFAKIIEATA